MKSQENVPFELTRDELLSSYGDPYKGLMSPYERVEAVLQKKIPDRTPFDFWGVPEVEQKLRAHLNANSDEEVLQLLGIDCRMVWPAYIGPELQPLADGTYFTPWGNHRRKVTNEFSTYEEYASFPLATAASAAEVEAWSGWPRTEYWDWSGVPAQIHALNTPVRHHIRYQVGGIFESAWGLYGLDRFLVDLYDRPEIVCAVMDCYTDLMIANVHNLMKTSSGLIDMVYTYDDVAVQNGLMMSPAMWRQYILPRHKRLNTVIKSYGLKIMYHSCGAIYPLVNELINEMQIDVLNPLQPRAKGMDMALIKKEFGERIAFHGGIDLQETMARGTPEQVQAEVRERINVLGHRGGYICTTAHYIQNDAPIANILALYTADRSLPD